jgi:hypothetical protein
VKLIDTIELKNLGAQSTLLELVGYAKQGCNPTTTSAKRRRPGARNKKGLVDLTRPFSKSLLKYKSSNFFYLVRKSLEMVGRHFLTINLIITTL